MTPFDTTTNDDDLIEVIEENPTPKTEKFLFTTASVAQLERNKTDYLGRQVWDTRLPGFGIAISKGGALSWFFQIRIRQQKSPFRRVVGKLSAYSTEAARREATRLIQHVRAHGVDPREVAPKEPDDKRTVYDLLAAWAAATARPDYRRDRGALALSSRANLRQRLPSLQVLWGTRQLATVTLKTLKEDIDGLTYGRLDRDGKPTEPPTPAMARAYKYYLSAAWRWARERDEWANILPDVNVVGIEVKAQNARTMTLTDDQLHKVLGWFDRHWANGGTTPSRDEAVMALELIALSGKRKGEIASIGMDKFMPHGPGDYTHIVIKDKTQIEGKLWLSGPDCPMRPLIQRALDARGGHRSPFLFPHLQRRKKDDTNPDGYGQINRALDLLKEDCGLPFLRPSDATKVKPNRIYGDQSFTVHDLRHAFTAAGSRGGLDSLALSKLLGHTSTEMVNKIYLNLQESEAAQFQRVAQRYMAGVRRGEHIGKVYESLTVQKTTHAAIMARADHEGATVDELLLKLLAATS